MKQVSLRELQQKASDYISELPFAITRYNKVIAYVVESLPENTVTTISPAPQERMGFCQLHFEKGTQYPLKEVYYEDVNGEASPKKLACSECIRKMIGEQKRSGGLLYIEGKRYA